MAGFEVTPRRQSSSISRWSSPLSIIPRRIWSSQTLVPAAVRAASRSFTPTVTLIAPPFPLGRCPRAGRLDHLAPELGGSLRRDPEVLVHVLRRPGLAEGVHAEELAVEPDPAVPTEPRRRLDGDARAAGRRQ